MDNILNVIMPMGTSEPPEKWDRNSLPGVDADMSKVPEEILDGENKIKILLIEFRNYLDQSKRVGSENTKRTYIVNSKQFLVWCNKIRYNINRVVTTRELKSLIQIYDMILNRTSLSRNYISNKMQSVRKFWEGINEKSELQNLDIKGVFNANNITTQDTNAFKNQIRISPEVYTEIKDIVHKEGDMSKMWIFFLLAHACRRSEIVIAKIDNIDTVNNQINIYEPKTGDIKSLPIPDWFTGKEMFAEGQIFIVTNNSQRTKKEKGKVPVSKSYIYDTTIKWLSKTTFAGQMKISPHSFRRYLVNSMQKLKYPEGAIAKVTGHKTTTMIYKYSYDNDISSNPIIENKDIKY